MTNDTYYDQFIHAAHGKPAVKPVKQARIASIVSVYDLQDTLHDARLDRKQARFITRVYADLLVKEQ